MQPELIALDLDGTLLHSNAQVSPRGAAAIAALRDRHVHVVLATGRPARMTRDYVHQLGLEHALVYNGASRYRASRDESEHHHELDRGTALAVIRNLRERLPDIGIGMETSHGWYLDAPMEARRREHPIRSKAAPPDGTGPVEEFVRDAVIKVFARHPTQDARAMGAALSEQDLYLTWTDAHMLEVMHPEVNKRDALARLAADLGVARDAVAALGDEHNDAQMLAWAGIGVAMGNAGPEAREAADEVTASNDEDGVALVLERWL